MGTIKNLNNSHNYQEIKSLLSTAFERFLMEMAPFWTKSNIIKAISPNKLEDEPVQKALKEMSAEGMIVLANTDEKFLILTPKYIKDVCGPKSEISDLISKQAQVLIDSI